MCALRYCKSRRGFSVTEAIVMLGILTIFTFIIIALWIHESGAIKDNGRQGALSSPIKTIP
jgi:competence protein ComGC